MASSKPAQAGAVEKKLVGVADTVITAAERSKDPTLAIPVRSLANVTFNAQRGIIELRFPYEGRFMFHAHQSEFAQLGWMGFFEVVA